MRRRCLVKLEGKVQAVGLRAQVRREAARHNLGGWVKNQPDGSVALEVEGEAASVALFLAWLKGNPGYAKLQDADVSEIVPQGDQEFIIEL